MTDKRPTDGWPSIPPFQRHMGIETVEAADGRSLLRYTFTGDHRNRKGDVHGGVLATLVDIAMSQAIRSRITDSALAGSATISMNVNYLEPATGPVVLTRGKAIKIGGSIAVAEATCESEDGRILVHATGSFRLIRHKKA